MSERLRIDRRVRRRIEWEIARRRQPDHFDIADRLTLGPHTYGKPAIRWYQGDTAAVRIGSYCSIADRVVMTIGGGHPIDWVSTYPFRIRFDLPGAYNDGLPDSKGDIVIGNDVWIGREARVLSGVTIAHGAVIAAYAVVAKDVPPYAIVAGNPARLVRYRHDPETIARLLALAWWDWPEERVRRYVPLLNGRDAGAFLDACERESDEAKSASVIALS